MTKGCTESISLDWKNRLLLTDRWACRGETHVGWEGTRGGGEGGQWREGKGREERIKSLYKSKLYQDSRSELKSRHISIISGKGFKGRRGAS
jgi:hypothetical protein